MIAAKKKDKKRQGIQLSFSFSVAEPLTTKEICACVGSAEVTGEARGAPESGRISNRQQKKKRKKKKDTHQATCSLRRFEPGKERQPCSASPGPWQRREARQRASRESSAFFWLFFCRVRECARRREKREKGKKWIHHSPPSRATNKN